VWATEWEDLEELHLVTGFNDLSILPAQVSICPKDLRGLSDNPEIFRISSFPVRVLGNPKGGWQSLFSRDTIGSDFDDDNERFPTHSLSLDRSKFARSVVITSQLRKSIDAAAHQDTYCN